MDNQQEAAMKRSRFMYILQAAFEYHIALLVTGSFLATITKEMGISDSVTGILSSIISLGCLFQLLSMLIRKNRVKRFVITMSVCNQLIFMLLYIIPLTDFIRPVKTALFVVAIVTAYLLYNLAAPKKTAWLMDAVEDRHRGTFTAKKEMFSLVTGMTFTYIMGAVSDRFAEKGEVRTAFIISAAVILGLTAVHVVTMLLTAERQREPLPALPLKKTFTSALKNKKVLTIAMVAVLYNAAAYASTPFFGTYQINELGFNLKFVAILAICTSVVRMCVSMQLGRYADRKSFAHLMEKCMMVLAVAFACAAMAVPANGKIMFVLYYAFHGIAMGGVSSSLINLIYDDVEPEKRADALAVTQSLGGVTGFLTTLAISPLVAHIQTNGNTFLGLPLYAQQVVSVIGILFAAAAALYLRFAIIRKRKKA